MLEIRNFISIIYYKGIKEEKWRVEGVYFIKDSLLIRADNCEEFE